MNIRLKRIIAGLILSGILFTNQIYADDYFQMGYEYTPMQQLQDRIENSIFNAKEEEDTPFDYFTKNNDTYIVLEDIARIDEKFCVSRGSYGDDNGGYISYNDISLNIDFTLDEKTIYIVKQGILSPSEHRSMLKDGKLYIPVKLIKEKFDYNLVIPSPSEHKKQEIKNQEPMIPAKGTTLGYVDINDQLQQARYIKTEYDYLINLNDYCRYIDCLWSYDEKTNTLIVRRGKSSWAEYKPGKTSYKLSGKERTLDLPPQRIGDDFYVALHLLARIKADIHTYTLDGKYIKIYTQEYLIKTRDAQRREYIEKYGQEAWDKEERNLRFLGYDNMSYGYEWGGWRDSLAMRPFTTDGNWLGYHYTPALPLDLSKESLTKTGEKLKMGRFEIPIYKGTIRYTSNPRMGKELIAEIRHPFGMMLTYQIYENKPEILIEIAENADIELVIKELYGIFAPEYTKQQVEALVNKAFKTKSLISAELERSMQKQKHMADEIISPIINSRRERCFKRFSISPL